MTEKVLIIGAGAGGMVTGYHLTLAGADISFYVRQKRVPELQSPQWLFSYDDGELKLYSHYQVLTQIDEIKAGQFDYVLVTLDGAAALSDEGSLLIEKIGTAIADSDCVLVSMGVAVGIREHYLDLTGLPEDRLLTGSFSFLSHPIPLAGQHIPPQVDQEKLAQAKYAYRHPGGKGGLTIAKTNEEVAKRFAALYNKSGESVCQLMSTTMVEVLFNALFPVLAASELAGWPALEEVVKEKKYWPMGTKAANEIMSLPRFGWQGKLFSRFMGQWAWKKLWLLVGKASQPLDFNAFNRFHHGGKVVVQDRQVLFDNLKLAEKEGIAMPNLKQLFAQLNKIDK